VLSGRDFCDEQITCREESYRLWSVVVCNLESTSMRRPWPTDGCRAQNKTWLERQKHIWSYKIFASSLCSLTLTVLSAVSKSSDEDSMKYYCCYNTAQHV
jgi:hypothetical protein